MQDNYSKIVQANLKQLFEDLPDDLDQRMGARREQEQFIFSAFGDTCILSREGIYLGGEKINPVMGILISLYALNAKTDQLCIEPLKAFREFVDSMPYVGAFTTHTELCLISHVKSVMQARSIIMEIFQGNQAPEGVGGDFSLMIRPLPKITLCYVFYEADQDFPSSVTCLFSANAQTFLPVDGLADLGEYTSKKIISILN